MIIKQSIYNGDLIHSRFAYGFLRDKVNPCGDIVAFRAPMHVDVNLIDLEDSIENDFIFSDDAINFCWEIPNLCPIGAVAFQRYLNTNIAKILQVYVPHDVIMFGDDIKVRVDSHTFKKASVSITYSKDNVAIGHTGINITAGDQAPEFAYSTGLLDVDVNPFIAKVQSWFYNETYDMFKATTKVIV
jgi:hypothetical protein